MRFGLIAVKLDVNQLVDVVPGLWPHFERKSSAPLSGLAALGPWMQANYRRPIRAAGGPDSPGTEVLAFWQDGDWAVMLDPTFVHAADDTALAALSERFGLTLSFIVESISSCAVFAAFDGGRLLRAIRSMVGETSTEGERMQQEAVPPDDDYYLNGTEPLQRAFGICPIGKLPADKSILGVAFVDHTDHGALRRAREQARAAARGDSPSA